MLQAFSGFYLPFMILLWLLMGRGLAIELHHHFQDQSLEDILERHLYHIKLLTRYCIWCRPWKYS